jgi:hypothetical protein
MKHVKHAKRTMVEANPKKKLTPNRHSRGANFSENPSFCLLFEVYGGTKQLNGA